VGEMSKLGCLIGLVKHAIWAVPCISYTCYYQFPTEVTYSPTTQDYTRMIRIGLSEQSMTFIVLLAIFRVIFTSRTPVYDGTRGPNRRIHTNFNPPVFELGWLNIPNPWN
jgi:hypothetical protein